MEKVRTQRGLVEQVFSASNGDLFVARVDVDDVPFITRLLHMGL